MVRLKDNLHRLLFLLFQFQFLHGAIKRIVLKQAEFAKAVFQFLHGAIKSGIDKLKTKSTKHISIPTWCD